MKINISISKKVVLDIQPGCIVLCIFNLYLAISIIIIVPPPPCHIAPGECGKRGPTKQTRQFAFGASWNAESNGKKSKCISAYRWPFVPTRKKQRK